MQTITKPNDILIPEIASFLLQGKQVHFTPTGTSMRPFIEGGKDSVILSLPSHLKVGDIALCQVEDKYLLHRIIAIKADTIILMGDGNLFGTEQTTRDKVFGIVTAIIKPNGRHKCLTRGWLWRQLLPVRAFLLKIYRHLFVYKQLKLHTK